MSTVNVKKMFAKVETDEKFRRDYIDIIKENESGPEAVTAGKLVELGKGAGFDFSAGDLFAARAELADTLNANAELSEKDLSGVAGGRGRQEHSAKEGLMTVFTLMIGCIITSACMHDENNVCTGGRIRG